MFGEFLQQYYRVIFYCLTFMWTVDGLYTVNRSEKTKVIANLLFFQIGRSKAFLAVFLYVNINKTKSVYLQLICPYSECQN